VTHRILLLFLLLALPAVASTNKKPEITVRFYPEAEQGDTETFAKPVQVPGINQTVYIKNIPTIYEKDIKALKTFQAADGSYGVMFRLSPHGRMTLELETQAYVGKLMVCVVNGAPVNALYIDRSITDGVIGIPSGLTSEQVETMEEAFAEKE